MVRNNAPCTLTVLLKLLHAEGLDVRPAVVMAELESLVKVRSLLRNRGQEYEFAVNAFPRVLSDIVSLSDLLLVTKDEFIGTCTPPQ